MRHPHYDGRKSETVASVGSRLFGVVKPSYGKARFVLASNPLKLTGDPKSFSFNHLGEHDLNAKSPYRLTRNVKQDFATIAKLNRQGKRYQKRSATVSLTPKLIKH